MKQIAFIAFVTRSSSMETSAREPVNPSPFFIIREIKIHVYGKREFVPRDQVFPLFFVYCLLLLHKNK